VDVAEPNAGVEGAPKAGVEEVPNAGVEVPNAEVEEASGEGVCAAPKTPVAVPPNIELPVCAPNGLVLPKGLGLNGLVFAVLVCPNVGCAPNGLELGCPNGLLDPNIVESDIIRSRNFPEEDLETPI
jgi:hypothetical protein